MAEPNTPDYTTYSTNCELAGVVFFALCLDIHVCARHASVTLLITIDSYLVQFTWWVNVLLFMIRIPGTPSPRSRLVWTGSGNGNGSGRGNGSAGSSPLRLPSIEGGDDDDELYQDMGS